jgi:hypothetical protein
VTGIPGTVLLSGIVGSTAYGLDHAGSDIDRLGMFAAPTERWLGLTPPAAPTASSLTWTSETKPDIVMHDALKVATLCLACNPTVTELLWLPDALYETRTPLGDELIGLRQSLLSAGKARDSYLRYAQRQFARLEARGDGSFSADTRRRTAKHSRHMWRLVQQGGDLNARGKLTVRLDAAQAAACTEFGERVAAGDLDIARAYLADAEEQFGRHPSALPAEPDTAAAEAWLLRVRREFYSTPENQYGPGQTA